jgi:hypothetical protein
MITAGRPAPTTYPAMRPNSAPATALSQSNRLRMSYPFGFEPCWQCRPSAQHFVPSEGFAPPWSWPAPQQACFISAQHASLLSPLAFPAQQSLPSAQHFPSCAF